MKIYISSMGNDQNSKPSLRFGRAPFFIEFDTENKAWQGLENDAVSASGGAGVAASQFLIDRQASVVISGKFGPNAYNSLSSAGIKLFTFKVDDCSVEEVLNQYNNGELHEVPFKGLIP